MGDEPTVRCGECLTNLAEPLNTRLEQRKPCPECGSLRRNVAVTLATTVVAGVDVTVMAPTATATASALTPEATISKLEELEYRIEWLRLSPGGAWMVRVYDGIGAWIDGSVQDNPADALLAVAERLLPE
jgi:hypothetical protein